MKDLMKRFRIDEAGFTLAELLVVVGIVVGLAAVILPNVGRFAGEGARGASATELASVQTALDAFASDTGTDIDEQASSIDTVTGVGVTVATLGGLNLDGYLRLPNGATQTSDCYTWDTDGTIQSQVAHTGTPPVCP